MKHYLTILTLIALAAAALFWKQVLGIFAGMSVLESLDMIVTYLLHIAVGTIAAVMVFGIPKIVMPWYRMFRRKQRFMRRGRLVAHPKEPVFKPRRMTVEQLLGVLAPNQNIQKTTVQPQEDRVDLKF